MNSYFPCIVAYAMDKSTFGSVIPTHENHLSSEVGPRMAIDPHLLLFLLLAPSNAHCSKLQRRHLPPFVFTDATALLVFKLKADVNNHLDFSPLTRGLRFCAWHGVECNGPKVLRLVLQNLDLGGAWAPKTLTRLDQLRVLSLQNNSLTGPIPDLTGLFNLKSLFLDNNHFTASLPPSLFSLHRLRNLDFSHNNFSGPIPAAFTTLDRLHSLLLSFNSFNGSIPPFNQSSLKIFRASANNLSGAVPVTPTVFRFPPSSFALNPQLCGEIIRVQCRPAQPFFGPVAPPTAALGQNAQVHGVNGIIRQPYEKKRHDRRALIIGFSAGIFVLVCSLACLAAAVRKQRSRSKKDERTGMMAADAAAREEAAAVMRMEMEEKVKRAEVAKSGGEAQVYTLEQLMKGSRSSRARPLHWTSCLKIAEDVAQGLAFIHQALRLVHGNLKSSNVLLGPDFEACITDYCLSVLTHPSIFDEDGDSAAYRAPETRNPNHHPTHKSDVYAYGILLLELLTGKFPSELPFMVPGDMSSWVRSIRDDNENEDNRMYMLLQVATTCSLTSPEQRPTMWQVLKMLQEIKEIVLLEDSSQLDLRSSNAIP
ncbi:putative inactive receptor kinase [Glycine soja]|uniref:Putative inactive receptor kinase n=1 Tax=Glycine soja TaxID=3848 RepID=A0A445K4P6_GLYSO|nr:putative inactive receptor kinase [Glycine soja]